MSGLCYIHSNKTRDYHSHWGGLLGSETAVQTTQTAKGSSHSHSICDEDFGHDQSIYKMH